MYFYINVKFIYKNKLVLQNLILYVYIHLFCKLLLQKLSKNNNIKITYVKSNYEYTKNKK